MNHLWLSIADFILIVHFAFVVFVVGGLLAIWLGWMRGWRFVRNFWFRALHLGAIALVMAESLAGFACPLTTWEEGVRRLAGTEERYAGSFIQHWVHRVMFFDLPERMFTIAYVVFFLLVALSLAVVRPRWPRRAEEATATPAR